MYGITEVCYNSAHQHIVQVKVSLVLGVNSLGAEQTWTRQRVVDTVNDTFYTYTRTGGQWVRGAKVEIVIINGTPYLRTDSNRTERDNLGELTEFNC